MKFFGKQKYQITVGMLKPKRDKKEDRMLTLTFRMALDTDTIKKAPEFIQSAYTEVRTNGADSVTLKKEIDGVNSDFYILDTSDTAEIRLPHLHLEKLAVKEVKSSQNDSMVALTFQADYPWDKAVWEWIGDHYSSDVFVRFDAAQASLLDIEENPEGEEVEDEEAVTA